MLFYFGLGVATLVQRMPAGDQGHMATQSVSVSPLRT